MRKARWRKMKKIAWGIFIVADLLYLIIKNN